MIPNKAKNTLTKMGFTNIREKPYEIIKTCDDWYYNELIDDFHSRKTIQNESYHLDRTNMAKRCCADDANLCEVVSIVFPEGEAETQAVNSVLENNRFQVVFREQLERLSASGTVATYLRVVNSNLMSDGSLQGGRIELNYVEPENIIPLTIENGEVKECAFLGEDPIKKKTTLVVFTQESGGGYLATTKVFNKEGIETSEDLAEFTVKPFSILKSAGANNIRGMEGFGVPKIWNAIPYLKGVDLAWSLLTRDLTKADKLILMNEKLVGFDDEGKVKRLSKSAKELFVLLGEALPSEGELYREYNPSVRIKEATDSLELCLSMLSMMFGYGTRKYMFENGQIKTATEYIGERQDSMQELNKQRENVKLYIDEISRIVLWLLNTYHGHTFNLEAPLTVDFDDSYIVDRQSRLEMMRQDAQALGMSKLVQRYLMAAYDLTETEAKAWYEDQEEIDEAGEL